VNFIFKYTFRVILMAALLATTACSYQQAMFQRGQTNFSQQNYHLAHRQLLPAAKGGNPQAQYAVGYMYFYGLGVVEDQRQGYWWIRQAAEKGDVEAQRALKLLKITKPHVISPRGS
jgi:TPR repeat protein